MRCYTLALRRLPSRTLHREKMKLEGQVVDQLVESSQADIRQVLNMLSTWKLSSTTMDFAESKKL